MTLSEMQAIAHALADFLPRYGGDGIDLVRDDLVRMVTDKTIDHQENIFTYLPDDLLEHAIEFLSVPEHATVVDTVSKSLPFIMPDGAANYSRLERDVRNSLLAKDMKMHQRELKNLKEKELIINLLIKLNLLLKMVLI